MRIRVLLVAGAVAPIMLLGSAPAGAQDAERSSASLPAQRRILHHFDFEEGAETPGPPRFMYRYGGRGDQSAASEGFPLFGDIRLDEAASAGGDWSLLLDLDGASIAVRTASSVLPVMPLNDYEVSVQVRTDGLVHARARLVAWLVDGFGEIIRGSRRSSAPTRTGGLWEELLVPIDGVYEDATDLIVELQLVQPRQYRGHDIPVDAPVPTDINGRAWFDDVVVRHVPRIQITTGTPGNVIVDPDEARLRVTIRDLVGGRLITELKIFDLDDRLVLSRDFDSTRVRGSRVVDIAELPHGWYRAVVDLTDETATSGRAEAGFLIMPASRARPREHARRFGLQLLDVSDLDLHLIDQLGVGAAVLQLESASTAVSDATAPERAAALQRGIDALLDEETDLVFALDLSLGGLVEQLEHGDAGTVLDEMLLRFGPHVHRWQLGTAFGNLPFESDRFQTAVGNAAAALGQYVADLVIMTPWRAEHALDDPTYARGYNVVLPYEMQPEALAELGPHWAGVDTNMLCTLQQLPESDYRPRQRVVDLMHRVLRGWRAELEQMVVAAPWTTGPTGAGPVEPTPTFGAWRTLVDQLSGRRYAGELKLGPGIHAWLLEGTPEVGSAIVAWSDIANVTQPVVMKLLLGRDPVTVVDAFGNRRSIAPENNVHRVPLDDMPVFIEDVNLALAQFRAGFGIEPPFVQTEHRQLDHSIVLTNPWDVALTGVVRIYSDDDWRMKPRVSNFTIRPGEELEVPLSIVPSRSITAGQKTVKAEFDLIAEEVYKFEAETRVEAGLKQIHLAEQWRYGRNLRTGTRDLIIQLQITNTSERVLNLSAFLSAPNMSIRRRAIGLLQPGEQVVRSFQIASGIELLSGSKVLVGVDEVDDVSRLIHEMVLPDFGAMQVVGAD